MFNKNLKTYIYTYTIVDAMITVLIPKNITAVINFITVI